MTHDCYSTKRTTVWASEKNGEAGYAIKYADGYISWCPQSTFERDYRAVTGGHLTFGQAIEALKSGKRVRRLGWNGKGMWLEFVPAERWAYIPTPMPEYYNNVALCSWIGMKTADEKFVPWLASQTDMIAEDWEEVS